MERILIIDGNNIAVRAWHVGNINNFFSMIRKVIHNINPHYFIIVFDNGKKSWRHKLYPEYKADRKETPEDLIASLSNLSHVLVKHNICVLDGPEADDVIYGICMSKQAEEIYKYILSSDKDMFGLVSNDIRAITFGRSFTERDIVTEDFVYEKMNVWPYQYHEFKALVGGHDNVPGCPLVGEKAAKFLLIQFGTIEEIYNYIDDIDILPLRDKARIKQSLIDNKEQVELSIELSRIRPNAPAFHLEDCIVPDGALISAMAAEMGELNGNV